MPQKIQTILLQEARGHNSHNTQKNEREFYAVID